MPELPPLRADHEAAVLDFELADRCGVADTGNTMARGYAGDRWVLDLHGHRVVAQELCDGCTADPRNHVARQVQSTNFPDVLTVSGCPDLLGV